MEIPPPKALKQPLKIPHKTLMGPGPSNIPSRVLQALNNPTLGHLHPETCHIMDEVKEGIQYVFQTRNELTLALSASGHGGMEAVLCNLLEPGDTALIAVNGIWGERAAQMAANYGAQVHRLEAKIGHAFTLAQIEACIARVRPQLFFITQGESSTGVYQNMEGVGDICHRFNCLLAVDTVASLGAVPFYADKWAVDAVYTGSQKVLGAPAGITPISFSKKAQRKIFERKTRVVVLYWDMTVLGDYWACFGRPRVYHHTISAHLLYALREALALVAAEGLENVVLRHQMCAQRLHDGLRKLDFELFVTDELRRLPTVTTVAVGTLNWVNIIEYAMKRYSLEISGGLGPTAGKVLRIGLMGENSTFAKVDWVLKVLGEARVKRSQL